MTWISAGPLIVFTLMMLVAFAREYREKREKAALKRFHDLCEAERAPNVTVYRFIEDFGWRTVQREEMAKLAESTPTLGSVYDAHDWYWQKQFEDAHPQPETFLMARFDDKGQCDVVRGTAWDVAVHQLNRMLELDVERYVSKPPSPIIKKRRAFVRPNRSL